MLGHGVRGLSMSAVWVGQQLVTNGPVERPHHVVMHLIQVCNDGRRKMIFYFVPKGLGNCNYGTLHSRRQCYNRV